MKRVILVGDDSYIACAFREYAKDRFEIKLVSSRNDLWRNESFQGFDSLIHCAGIAHIKQKREFRDLYFQVNCNLAIEVAKKAKSEGVAQFIFLSTMAVFGLDSGIITKSTSPCPKSNDYYGQSKYEAEQAIQTLSDEAFHVLVVRPPMVYGPGCKGNFQKLVKVVPLVTVFPNVHNQRSMIFIDTLCECFARCIELCLHGICYPQNSEYMSTSTLIDGIARTLRKRVYFSAFLNILIPIAKLTSTGRKIFGSLIYDKSLICSEFSFSQPLLTETIKKSVCISKKPSEES